MRLVTFAVELPPWPAKKDYPVYIDEFAEIYDVISVANGGKSRRALRNIAAFAGRTHMESNRHRSTSG
jgi:hypothetical protein